MEPVRVFSTRPVNFKIYAGRPAGWPVSDRPGRPFFFSLSNASNEKISKRGSTGEVLKFVTRDGVLRKKNAKIWKPFWLNFGLKDLFWAAQNVDKISLKKNWRAQAKLLDVLSNDIMRKAKIKS